MKILQLHELNKHQKSDIEVLVQECLKADGLKRTIYLDNDMNFFENLDSFYLLYNGRRLVSVLAIYEPLEEEAEITAYTLPTERKRGFFKTLFYKALKELLRFGLYRILFVVEPRSESGLSAIKACKANYFKSEYLLLFRFHGTKEEQNSLIELKEITGEKQEEAVDLSSKIFCTDTEETRGVIELALNTQYMNCYGACLDGHLVGICNVSYGQEKASIFGFGIAPDLQGKSYGRLFLQQVMNMIHKKGIKSVTLHVGSENTRAYSLYTSVGFTVQTQYDYYEYMIEGIK